MESLKSRNHRLSSVDAQIERLENGQFASNILPTFEDRLHQVGIGSLKPNVLEVLQLNLGYMCNQTCKHCHVDAGPDRKEVMVRSTMEECIKLLNNSDITTVDLTGGAPEMNPHFRWFVSEIAKTSVKEIIVRSNLTILLTSKHKQLPEFFSEYNIRVVSSLPFYLPDKTDRQRGEGVFVKSIEALRKLNKIGYGINNDLILDLVYNPSGAFLPADQSELERDFKRELKNLYDVKFNSLLTITNLPISRFLDFLIKTENFEEYMETLVSSFNPQTLNNLMCTNTLSVGWDGHLYDCDFNQMLSLKVNHKSNHISNIDLASLNNRSIKVNNHCYGCTAGAGSSCQGILT